MKKVIRKINKDVFIKKNISELKKFLKQNGYWSNYKELYKHRQMKFVASKIALIFDRSLSINELVELELKMMDVKINKGENMFKNVFGNFEKLVVVKGDWASFSKMMFYIYQTSTYWRDKKNNVENVFTGDNYVEINAIKRNYYYQWLNSLDLKLRDYNILIIEVMRRIF